MADTLNPVDFRERVAEYLEAASGKPVEIKQLRPLAGGVTRDSWFIQARIGDEQQQLVLRRDMMTEIDERALERDQEFLLMQAACAAGVLVPRPRWYCTEPCILGAPFLIMDYVEGISIGSQVVNLPELADARHLLPEQMGQQLARIHAIKADNLTFLPRPRPGYSPSQETLLQMRAALLKLGVHNPVLVFALRWVEKHLPPGGDVVVLHGDFRVGNLIVSKDRLKGVVDWEFGELGDPYQDLAWPCVRGWRYGHGEMQLGGIGQREPFLLAYEQASGRTVDRQIVDFWEIMGNLRWGVAALAQAQRHLSGKDTSVELASIGRRSAETQLEALRLIARQGI
jgi:aminoglycoside phosphotransferase (APT) family kinase protein